MSNAGKDQPSLHILRPYDLNGERLEFAIDRQARNLTARSSGRAWMQASDRGTKTGR